MRCERCQNKNARRQCENSAFTPSNAKLTGKTPSGRCSLGENGAIGSSGETWDVAGVRVLSSLAAAA